MNCAEIQLTLGAEPGVTSPELEAHLRECAACVQYQREMRTLDDNIRRALMVDIDALVTEQASVTPIGAAAVRASSSSKPAAGAAWSGYSRRRHWALAASVLAATATVLVLWGALPRHSLAADVVSHVVSETIDGPLEGAVDESAVRAVMERSGLQLDPINPSIVFVRTCFLRGRLVPHFIVRTEHGTAAVMVLPNEHVKSPEHFDGNGYKGLIVPDAQRGSIVVLSRSDFDMEHYAGEIRRAVHSMPAKTGS